MFVLTDIEYTNLRSQFVTSSWGGTRYPPMAFTEQGVAILSSVLRSEVAINVNIQIIRLFTKIRSVLMDESNMRLTLKEMKGKVEEHDQKLDQVFRYLQRLHAPNSEKRKKIGFKKK